MHVGPDGPSADCRSCKRGNWKRASSAREVGRGGQLESGTVQLHRGLKMASCNDERRLDEKLNRIAVITNFLSLLHLELPSHLSKHVMFFSPFINAHQNEKAPVTQNMEPKNVESEAKRLANKYFGCSGGLFSLPDLQI